VVPLMLKTTLRQIRTLERRRNFLLAREATGPTGSYDYAERAALDNAIADLRELLGVLPSKPGPAKQEQPNPLP